MRLSGVITRLSFSLLVFTGACAVDESEPEDSSAVEQELKEVISYYCDNGSATDSYGSCTGSTLEQCKNLVEGYAKYSGCTYTTGGQQ